MTAPRRGVGGVWLFGAVTIEPFEVSRWRGGCGRVYGISMGMCQDGRCFCGKSGKQSDGDSSGMAVKSSAGGRQRGRYLRGAGVERA